MKTFPNSKFILRASFLALTLAAATSVANADTITFSYFDPTASSVSASQGGLTSTYTGVLKITDTTTGLSLTYNGSVAVSTGGAGSTASVGSTPGTKYETGSSFGSAAAHAVYGPGGSVEVLSASCTDDICLQGTENGGTFYASEASAGTATGGLTGGSFNLTYVDPAILAFFGDSMFGNTGVDSVEMIKGTIGDPTVGKISLGGSTPESSISFSAGSIIPEPGTLTLFGTGLLGMAGLLRRKYMVSR